MGIGGISIGSLLVVLVIVMLLFGTRRLRGLGGDLGAAVRGFRSAVNEGEAARDEAEAIGYEAAPVEAMDAERSR